LLLSVPAVAQVEALSKRYHEAYVLEVIDGKPAEAAKAYLALLQEKDLPERLREQTEFRFAVTCVLLGRADEARARLAALAAKPGLPVGLRAQVEEYRKAIAEVKLGTALETNLQALTMKLSRHSAVYAKPATAIYVEFEVLGPRTIPYVRTLLRHKNKGLRWHAFQILARMDEPNLVDIWDPMDVAASYTLRDYFNRHRDQIPKLEKKLRAMKGGSGGLLRSLSQLLFAFPFSREFTLWVVQQPGCERIAVVMLAGEGNRVKSEPVILDWMRNGSPKLQAEAARGYGSWAAREDTKKPADLYAKYCTLLDPQTQYNGFKEYTASVPPAVRLQALSAVIELERPDPKRARGYLIDGTADRIADEIDKDVGKAVDPRAYGKLIERWLGLIHTRAQWKNLQQPLGVMVHLRRVVVAVPQEEALRIVENCQAMFGSGPIALLLGFERASDAALIRAVLERIDSSRDTSRRIPETLARSVDYAKADPAYLRAIVPLWPALARWMGHSMDYMWLFEKLAVRVPEQDARDALVATVMALAGRGDRYSERAVGRLFPLSTRRHEDGARRYVSRVLIPVLPTLLAKLPHRLRMKPTRARGAGRSGRSAASGQHLERAVESHDAVSEAVSARSLGALPEPPCLEAARHPGPETGPGRSGEVGKTAGRRPGHVQRRRRDPDQGVPSERSTGSDLGEAVHQGGWPCAACARQLPVPVFGCAARKARAGADRGSRIRRPCDLDARGTPRDREPVTAPVPDREAAAALDEHVRRHQGDGLGRLARKRGADSEPGADARLDERGAPRQGEEDDRVDPQQPAHQEGDRESAGREVVE
ncbi:MAG: hypothetical protein ACYTGZ_14795, partial [Planctomycetota bacterium]